MNNFKKLREEHNLTQDKLASLLEIKQTTYSNYEKGKTEAPYCILKKLSKIYNVTIDYLLCNETKGLTIYTEEQKTAISTLVELEQIYLAQATGYLKALKDEQERIKKLNFNLNK